MHNSLSFYDAINTRVCTWNIPELNCLFARDNYFSRSNLKIKTESDAYNKAITFNLDYEYSVITIKLFARW